MKDIHFSLAFFREILNHNDNYHQSPWPCCRTLSTYVYLPAMTGHQSVATANLLAIERCKCPPFGDDLINTCHWLSLWLALHTQICTCWQKSVHVWLDINNQPECLFWPCKYVQMATFHVLIWQWADIFYLALILSWNNFISDNKGWNSINREKCGYFWIIDLVWCYAVCLKGNGGCKHGTLLYIWVFSEALIYKAANQGNWWHLI